MWKYEFNGEAYHLEKEGLYRFVHPNIENKQRIVYDGDVQLLIASISWIQSHGNEDNGKSQTELESKAMTSKLLLTASPVNAFVKNILDRINIPSRLVNGLTLEKWTSYDSGYSFIEVFSDDLDKWVVYDINMSLCFYENYIPLSFMEFVGVADSGQYRMKRISSNISVDISHFTLPETGYDFAFIAEYLSANEQSLRNWLHRTMQVPMIQKGNHFYFTCDPRYKDHVTEYNPSFQYMDYVSFINEFYPN